MCASEIYISSALCIVTFAHTSMPWNSKYGTEKKNEDVSHKRKIWFWLCRLACHFRLCVCFVLSHVRRESLAEYFVVEFSQLFKWARVDQIPAKCGSIRLNAPKHSNLQIVVHSFEWIFWRINGYRNTKRQPNGEPTSINCQCIALVLCAKRLCCEVVGKWCGQGLCLT